MSTIFKNAPVMIEKKRSAYITLVSLLTAISIVPLFMPVIVCFLSEFTRTEGVADNIYYILRGVFGISLAVGAAVYAVNKKISAAAVPSLIGFIMLLFPLYTSVADYTSVLNLADQLGMTVDYTLYIVNIAIYLLFTLLCLFTFLFSVGWLKQNLVILLLSVISSLFALYISIERYFTLEIALYDVICFAYSVTVSIIPTVIVMSAKPVQKKEKYIPKRTRS